MIGGRAAPGMDQIWGAARALRGEDQFVARAPGRVEPGPRGALCAEPATARRRRRKRGISCSRAPAFGTCSAQAMRRRRATTRAAPRSGGAFGSRVPPASDVDDHQPAGDIRYAAGRSGAADERDLVSLRRPGRMRVITRTAETCRASPPLAPPARCCRTARSRAAPIGRPGRIGGAPGGGVRLGG